MCFISINSYNLQAGPLYLYVTYELMMNHVIVNVIHKIVMLPISNGVTQITCYLCVGVGVGEN